MFGIGFFELLIIAVFALIFVGPKKLPDVMRQAGKFFVQMRRTANDVRSTFDQVVKDAEDELRKEDAAQLKALLTGNVDALLKPTDTPQLSDSLPHDSHAHTPHSTAPSDGHGHMPNLTQDAAWHPVHPGHTESPASSDSPLSEPASPQPKTT